MATDRWPGIAMGWIGLGTALGRIGRADDAILAFRRALALAPDLAPAAAGLATTLQTAGAHAAAEAQFRRALTLAPHDALLRAGFAQTLRALGRRNEAESQARLAVHIAPAAPLGHLALGAALADAGAFAEARDAFRAGVALPPDNDDAALAVGMIRLLLGDYPAGWVGYQNRVGAGPGWPTGTRLAGAKINVRPEQGLGDTLQFVRWLTLLADQGARVGFDAPALLRRLLAGLPGVADARIRLERFAAADFECALLDLGALLATHPAPAQPLAAPAADMARWAANLAPDGRRRIGLAWSGNPAHGNDHARSAGIAAFAPLLAVPQCRFIAVQTPPGPALPAAVETPELTDFADTAGLMANLDLIISVDTAPAHLAGTLGRPVWIMLAALPDWRWQLTRDDTPWYPSARLFRQPLAGDWATPIAEAASALRALPIPARRPIG